MPTLCGVLDALSIGAPSQAALVSDLIKKYSGIFIHLSLDKVWQDSAGTIIGEVDSPIGKILCAADSGYWAGQATSNLRPLLRTDQYKYIEFDSNDELAIPALGAGFSSAWLAIAQIGYGMFPPITVDATTGYTLNHFGATALVILPSAPSINEQNLIEIYLRAISAKFSFILNESNELLVTELYQLIEV